MPPAAAIGGALAIGGIGSAIAGGVASNNASKRAAGTAASNAERFYNFDDPNYEAMKLKLDQLQSQGQLTPEMEQAVLQDPSLLNNVTEDPRLRKADIDALNTLSQISSEQGLDAGSRAKLLEAQLSNDAAARGHREANLQQAAQRGVAGTGLEFVSNQMADQNAANQNALTGTQAAADASAREIAALTQMGNLGNQTRSQDFAQAQAKANAQNDINRFNAQAQQAVQGANVSTRNAAQAGNLAEAQRIADANVGIRNQQQTSNAGLEQTKFNNNLARAQGAAGLTGSQVQAQTAQGQQQANLYGGLGQSLIGTGASIYANSNDPLKQKQAM
jgi:hypothetical protein